MKVTATYMKFDANPFRSQPGGRVASFVGRLYPSRPERRAMLRVVTVLTECPKAPVPSGYVFVGIDRGETNA